MVGNPRPHSGTAAITNAFRARHTTPPSQSAAVSASFCSLMAYRVGDLSDRFAEPAVVGVAVDHHG